MLSKAKIKYIRSLQQKKFRQKYRSYIAEGHKIVYELLKSTENIISIYGTADWIESNFNELREKNCEYHAISKKDIERISGLSTAQDVIAIVEMPEAATNYTIDSGLILAIDSISDPGNFGTILRSADWFGVNCIYCSENCVDVYNPKVVQSSMGSIFRVKVVYTDLEALLKNAKTTTYAATLNGKEIDSIKFQKDALLLIGNESNGIDPELIRICNYEVKIPGPGSAESLNVAVAASILMFCMNAQR